MERKSWLDAGVAYARALPVSAQVLTFFRLPLRRLMAPLITRLNRRHEKSWFRPVRPEIERRLKEYEGLERHRGSQWTQTPNDFLNWSTEQGKETRDPGMCAYKNLVARLLLVKVVSVHASAFAITHILLDLVGSGRGFAPC